MIEISRTQDEEVGDGTTSVIILGKVSRAYISHSQQVVMWVQALTGSLEKGVGGPYGTFVLH